MDNTNTPLKKCDELTINYNAEGASVEMVNKAIDALITANCNKCKELRVTVNTTNVY